MHRNVLRKIMNKMYVKVVIAKSNTDLSDIKLFINVLNFTVKV